MNSRTRYHPNFMIQSDSLPPAFSVRFSLNIKLLTLRYVMLTSVSLWLRSLLVRAELS